MAERCGVPHPEDPSRTCIVKDTTHGDHADVHGIWPNTERIQFVQQDLAARDRKKRKGRLRSVVDKAREGKREILGGDGVQTGIPVEAREAWSKDAWLAHAEQVMTQFLKSHPEDFTTAEDLWPLLEKPEEMRALSVVVQRHLKIGSMVEVAAKRLKGVYHTKDGFEFAENKLVPVYRSQMSPR